MIRGKEGISGGRLSDGMSSGRLREGMCSGGYLRFVVVDVDVVPIQTHWYSAK